MTFELASGVPVVVGPRLAAGGQGEVFSVSFPQAHVFKKYFPRELAKDPALEQRLLAMIRSRPQGWREFGGHITMAWPTDAVYEDGQFAGFVMPAIDMAATVGIHRITNPSDRRRASPSRPGAWMAGFSWRYLVRAAANLVRVTQAMHEAGTVIGDFNDANVRVGQDARITLLDCDSMQITDAVTGGRYFCRVGRPEFTAPELLQSDWNTTVREPASDIFALSIHLYALLLEGEHPFRGVWDWEGEKPPVTELATRGIWAYQEGGPLLPRPAAIGIDLLPGTIRELFRTAFEHGSYSPDHRPSAGQWYTALRELEAHLQTCSAEPSHVYPGFHREACPWCEHARRVPPPPEPPEPKESPERSEPPTASASSGSSPSSALVGLSVSRGSRASGGAPAAVAGRGGRLQPGRPSAGIRGAMSPLAAPVPARPAVGHVPATWREHWYEHDQLLRLYYSDSHTAIYLDPDVSQVQARWLPDFISRGWQYTKATYGDGFGPDPRLFSVHHAGRYPGGHRGFYDNPDHDYRNTIDVGPGPWTETDEFSRDWPFHEISHLVEFASNSTHGSPAYRIWGESKWAEFFVYDLHVALGFNRDAQHFYNKFTTRHVDDFPRPGTRWFRDWFYPLWRDYGQGAVMARFFRLLAQHFPFDENRRYVRDLNWGEYIHFTSGAAGGDLRHQAASAFGWHAAWDVQFAKACEDFPGITY